MTIRWNGALSRRLAGSALGGLIAFAFVPAAQAQWLPPPWRAAFPGEIARSLEARGYMLTAPLLRRPGIYLADVSAGPAGYQRLIVDARSGQILESFPASGRMWGPALASRGEEFGEPASPGMGGPTASGEFSGEPAARPAPKLSSGGPAGVHIPAAVSPFGPGAAPLGAKPKTKIASLDHKIAGAKTAIANPPLPPPAPRETRAEESGIAPEASDKAKVSIVPPAPFE